VAYVYKNPHESSYLAAQQELTQLDQEEAEIGGRLAWIQERKRQLAAYLEAVKPLMEEESGQAITEAGLTQLCRDVLARLGRWVTAQEVRSALAMIGVDISGYTNPMAVLHAILKRVGKTLKDPKGNIYYWSGEGTSPTPPWLTSLPPQVRAAMTKKK
jgi:hypothetical protein